MQKTRIIEFVFKIGYTGSLKWKKKNYTDGWLRLHIYLLTRKILIHNSLYVFDKWDKYLSHKKM